MADAPRLRQSLDLMPLDQVYQDREKARQEQEWQSLVGQPQGTQEALAAPPVPVEEQRVAIDVSEENLAAQAEQAALAQGFQRGIVPPQESTSEVVRERAVSDLASPAVRQGVDKVLQTLTGVGLDELQEAVNKGTLPEKVSMRLGTPIGNVSEALIRGTGEGPTEALVEGVRNPVGTPARDAARRVAEGLGLEPGTVDIVGTLAGLIAPMLVPGATGASGAIAALSTEQRVARLRQVLSSERGSMTVGGAGEPTPPRGPKPPVGQPNVNVGRVEAAPAVQRAMKEINAGVSPRMAEARVPVPHEQTIEAARGFSLNDALTFDPATVDQKALQTALRDYYNAASTRVVEFAKGVKEGTASREDLLAAYALASELAVRDELIGKGFARGLESRKIMSKSERGAIAIQDMAALANRMALSPDADPVLLADRFLALETKTQRQGYLRQVGTGFKHGQDLLYDAWINWILSGPQTHVANVMSTSIVTGWAPAERLLSAALDLPGYFGHRSVFFGEVPSQIYGAVVGFREGVRLAGRALREGVSEFGPEKAERLNVWPSDRWGKESVVGNALDLVYGAFKLGGVPTRALVVEDAFFKGVNYMMELHALAWREASLQGLSGREFYRHMAQILDNPGAYPAIKTRAENFALIQTLNQELSELGRIGEIGGAAMKVADLVPMGRTAAPFIRTPTNELHMVAERFPALGALLDTMRSDLLAGGERRALALGKQGTGALVVAAVGMYGTAPIDPDNPIPYMTRLTGGGPKNKSDRDNLLQNGWLPYAVWDPATKEYHRISRLGPLATVLTASMDTVEIAAHARQTASTFLFATVNAVGRTMLDKSYFTGLANFFDSMQGNAGDVSRFIRSMERSVVPAGVRQLEGVVTPERASTLTSAREAAQFDPMWREWEQFKNETMSTIPYLSTKLPVMLNRWGDPQLVPPGWGPDLVSPVASGRPKNDPVLNELISNEIRLPVPSPYVGGPPEQSPFSVAPPPTSAPGVQLEPDEYHRYVLLAGKGGAAPGLTSSDVMWGRPSLYEAIEYQINLPEWKTFSRWEKNLRAQSIARTYDQLALKQLRTERPELDSILRAHVVQQAEEKLRSTDPRSPNYPGRALPGAIPLGTLTR